MLSTDPRFTVGSGPERERASTSSDRPRQQVRDPILEAAASATRRFLGADSWEGCIDEVLERLGRAASASRAAVFQNHSSPDGEIVAERRSEWVAAGALPTDGSSEHEHGVSVAIVPIYAGEDRWGYMRLDHESSERERSDAEVAALGMVADALGAVILRRETEDAHREAEFRYRSLVEHIPMMATYMDEVIVGEPGHSNPLYISPQIEDMLGYPREAWLTDDELWLQVLHPDDADRMTREDENARRSLTPLSTEYRMIAHDGHVVWVSEKSTVVEDEDTGTLYWQGVMVDITERKRIEADLLAARRKLLDQSVRAGEEERRRIAADLHDGPVQHLARLKYVLERTRFLLKRGDLGGLSELLDSVVEDLAQEIQELRRMMTDLRPPILDHMGLGSALRDHAADVGRRSGLRCVVETTFEERLDPAVETVLYRVAQEALTNVVKHARGEHAWLSLQGEQEAVVLEVRDDGKGFDPADVSTLAKQERFGLIGMQERVEMAGGRWDIRSAPGAGTTVRAVIPRLPEGLP